MMTNAPSETLVARKRGRISQALFGLFMKEASVVSAEALNPDFYLITLHSPSFVGTAWTPGQKLQIFIDSSFSTRSYTPLEWDSEKGQTRIVVYAHGPGPGTAWARGVQEGDTCEIFGPRASLDLTSLHGPTVILGDETSFGLSIAIARQKALGPTRHIFEVNSIDRAQTVLQRFDVKNVEFHARTPGDEHLSGIEERLRALASPDTNWIVTGKAGSIQRLRLFLRTISATRAMTKAYWAPGKTGLD